MIRSWPLYYNPCNDHLLTLTAEDPRQITFPRNNIVCEEVCETHEEGKGEQEEKDPELTKEVYAITTGEDSLLRTSHTPKEPEGIEDVYVTAYDRTDTGAWSKEDLRITAELDDQYHISLTMNSVQCNSVTAGSVAEREALRLFAEKLPVGLKEVVKKYPRLFSPPDAIPPPREVCHDIKLKPDVVPVRRPPYTLGDVKLAAMKTQVKELAEQGWISPSCSPWGAPILFVKKKEGEWRMCIDFRDLNALTVDDSFPMPRLDVLLHRAGAAKFFSKIDLASGFHQIALTESAREMTAFRLPEPVLGCTHWQWNVMPFGLKNAPPTFQRAMTKVLRGSEDFAVVYMDDVMIFSHSVQDHLRHLDQVFAKMEQESYHIRLPKCEFLQTEVEFLGHQLSQDSVRTSPLKGSSSSGLESASAKRQTSETVSWA